jgi:uncharacterized membrane protein YedE/YeeE
LVNFTPVSAALGGVLIGAATVLLVLAIGRLAGVSGIVAGTMRAARGDLGWRLAFLAGLMLAPLVYALSGAALPEVTVATSPLLLAGAGLLVGFGTRLGSGCTSGHGVCGVARLSRRSLTATAVFMLTAAVTVFLMRHVGG